MFAPMILCISCIRYTPTPTPVSLTDEHGVHNWLYLFSGNTETSVQKRPLDLDALRCLIYDLSFSKARFLIFSDDLKSILYIPEQKVAIPEFEEMLHLLESALGCWNLWTCDAHKMRNTWHQKIRRHNFSLSTEYLRCMFLLSTHNAASGAFRGLKPQ